MSFHLSNQCRFSYKFTWRYGGFVGFQCSIANYYTTLMYCQPISYRCTRLRIVKVRKIFFEIYQQLRFKKNFYGFAFVSLLTFVAPVSLQNHRYDKTFINLIRNIYQFDVEETHISRRRVSHISSRLRSVFFSIGSCIKHLNLVLEPNVDHTLLEVIHQLLTKQFYGQYHN